METCALHVLSSSNLYDVIPLNISASPAVNYDLSYCFFRPDILKQEIKAFFVKYNDPIYVKLEKLDIMIRLASQQNIGQVLAELKELVASQFSLKCFWPSVCINLHDL